MVSTRPYFLWLTLCSLRGTYWVQRNIWRSKYTIEHVLLKSLRIWYVELGDISIIIFRKFPHLKVLTEWEGIIISFRKLQVQLSDLIDWIHWLVYCSSFIVLYRQIKVKVKQVHYRPGQAVRVPGGWGSQISWHSAHEGGKLDSPTHRPPLPPRKYFWYSFRLEAYRQMPR